MALSIKELDECVLSGKFSYNENTLMRVIAIIKEYCKVTMKEFPPGLHTMFTASRILGKGCGIDDWHKWWESIYKSNDEVYIATQLLHVWSTDPQYELLKLLRSGYIVRKQND